MITDAYDGRQWCWSNIPIPKSHVPGLTIGFVLRRIFSWQLPTSRRTAWAVGLSLIGLNIVISWWAVLLLGFLAENRLLDEDLAISRRHYIIIDDDGQLRFGIKQQSTMGNIT